MKGYLTSLVGMFNEPDGNAPQVTHIEIPLIQRDYAQGRVEPNVGDIRLTFLDVLLDALDEAGEPVGLDFIYGRVKDGVLHPLDGQQRLTTLLLLHWYIASRTNHMDPASPWARLSYATRPGARTFCQRLTSHPLPADATDPASWVVDQSWYLHVWQHDPTIQAMLVTLGDIATRTRTRLGTDLESAWARLTSLSDPAISFYLLPLDDLESEEDLYIKMNSRGKPLTEFETFKARFEQDISHLPRSNDFTHRIDGPWSDLLWPLHGGDNIIDDEFIRYIDYITEICEFRQGRPSQDRLAPRARRIFGDSNEQAAEHLDFLFHCFDTWESSDSARHYFDDLFTLATPGQDGYSSEKCVLFAGGTTNLLRLCCQAFDRTMPQRRSFSLQQSLLLYAVLLHKRAQTEDFPRRLRILRNLLAASEDELRLSSMPGLLADVETLIGRGDLTELKRLSRNQIDDELLKRDFLNANPHLAESLFRLEDHTIFRGTLHAIEYDSEHFLHRADVLESCLNDRDSWIDLTGALLTAGDYYRQPTSWTAWQFGTSSTGHESAWRLLLTNGTRDQLTPTRTVLARFLDRVVSEGENRYSALIEPWLAERETNTHLDWRYYLVKYPNMRTGDTGIYLSNTGSPGYELCMLRTKQRNGYYRDPILYQVWLTSQIGNLATDPWFTSYEYNPRWLKFNRSGVQIRNCGQGFVLQPPEDESHMEAFRSVCAHHGIDPDQPQLSVEQRETSEGRVDTTDRVTLGARLVADLAAAGL